jgi:hypothetical protein
MIIYVSPILVKVCLLYGTKLYFTLRHMVINLKWKTKQYIYIYIYYFCNHNNLMTSTSHL